MQKFFSLVLAALFLSFNIAAQQPDKVYAANIHNIKLNYSGNQLAYPVIKLNSGDQLDLNFDDLDGGVRNYSYTWQLCNADWSKTELTEFDYIRGFTQNRITTYRNSSVALIKYTHYMVTVPESSCVPSRSGNYLLKVFADGDTSNLLFTRRVLVVGEKTSIAAQILQPFNGQIFKTHQKITFTIGLGNVSFINPLQQIQVYILQNNRWDNAISNIKPSFIRQNSLEYSSDDIVFPGGREWRWLDLSSLRLQSDRVGAAKYNANSTDIFVKPDVSRITQRLVFYKDYDGIFFNQVSESGLNYLWQADFADTHFTYAPENNQAFADKDIYLFGELTNYGLDDKAKMIFNADKGVYETDLLLKNGHYDYTYITIDKQGGPASFEFTEGNLWDTENNYTILVYYRAINGRSDELVGVAHINSLTGRNGN
jgi:hypothetical protein